jgi:hypothetical protein
VGIHAHRRRHGFLYARLWSCSGVLTDLEFYELRYSAASPARCVDSAPSTSAFSSLHHHGDGEPGGLQDAAILFGMERWQTLLAVGLPVILLRT